MEIEQVSAPDYKIEVGQDAWVKKELEKCLSDKLTRDAGKKDFTKTFTLIGMGNTEALSLSENILASMENPNLSMEESETEVSNLFRDSNVDGKTFFAALKEKMAGRANIIFSQISEYFNNVKGEVIDYGTGDGQVAQKLKDTYGLSVTGFDVRDFRASEVNVPIVQFNGSDTGKPDSFFSAGLMTNVAHHEADNQKILQELARIIQPGGVLVVIETVPTGDTAEAVQKDWGRTFLNDVLWNRYFKAGAHIPVPGTYEIPTGWGKRFEDSGFEIIESRDLGIDQPTVQDVHHLLVMKRK